MNDSTRLRCADGRACVEVVSRLHAADVAEYVLDRPDVAAQLRATAERFARVHLEEQAPAGCRS